MKQQKAKTSMYKDIIKLKILFLMWVPLLSYGQVKCEDLYEKLLPLRERLNLVSSSKKINLLSKEMEENRKINGGYAYAYLDHQGPVKIRYADNVLGVRFLDRYGKERSVTKRTQIRGISRYNSTARDHFEPLDRALYNHQMPKDRYILYKGQDAKIIDMNNDWISIMILIKGMSISKQMSMVILKHSTSSLLRIFLLVRMKFSNFDKFLEKGGFDENWVFHIKNSGVKRAYGEIERVNHDELYLKISSWVKLKD